MASKALASLSAETSLAGTETFYADTGSLDVKVSANTLKGFANTNLTQLTFQSGGTINDSANGLSFKVGSNTFLLFDSSAQQYTLSGTATDTPILELDSLNDGTAGAHLNFFQNSASPAASDYPGQILVYGKDSAAHDQLYTEQDYQIVDPTHGSEDSAILFRVLSNSASITPLTIDGSIPNLQVGTGVHIEFPEISDPSAPGANKGRLYVRDNGAGKSQLVCRFPSGAVQVIVTEP